MSWKGSDAGKLCLKIKYVASILSPPGERACRGGLNAVELTAVMWFSAGKVLHIIKFYKP